MPKKASVDLNQSLLYKVTSPAKLAKALGVTVDDLRSLTALKNPYREFEIAKGDGGKRPVEDPVYVLKRVHTRIARMLARIHVPEFLHCPVKGRSYVTNAAAHKDNRVVKCLDIKKFFPNTPSQRVFWFFTSIMKCREDVAGLLTSLLTYNGRLATGSPVSPILAYYSFYDMWQELNSFCAERNYTLTVYVDDLTISAEKVPQRDIFHIKSVIRRFNLIAHKDKSFIDRPAEITGVIVNKGKLIAPHKQYRKQRVAKKMLTADPQSASLLGKVRGLNGQIRQIAAG